MPPLASICLPNFNKRPFLEARMQSILSQTLTDWELIIVDNCSDDGSWEFFQKFKSDPRISMCRTPKKEMYANWNDCLSKATGKYIYIATSDDTAKPEFLEKMVGVLEKYPDVGLALCMFDFIDKEGNIIYLYENRIDSPLYKNWLTVPHKRNSECEFLAHVCLDMPWATITSVLFSSALIKKIGFFRTDCGRFADKFWAMKATLQTDTIFLPESLATWRRYEGQATPKYTERHSVLFCLRLVSETIDECIEQIPKSWRTQPRWKEKLLWYFRRRYLNNFHLNRGYLKHHFLKFIGGCANAAIHEPRYLLRRLTSGLVWKTEDIIEPEEMLWKLIHEWGIEWQPKQIEL